MIKTKTRKWILLLFIVIFSCCLNVRAYEVTRTTEYKKDYLNSHGAYLNIDEERHFCKASDKSAADYLKDLLAAYDLEKKEKIENQLLKPFSTEEPINSLTESFAVALSWNLALLQLDENPNQVDRGYFVGSAVLIKTKNFLNRYALTSGHVITQSERFSGQLVAMSRAVSHKVFFDGRNYCKTTSKVQVLENFYDPLDPDKPDLAILTIEDWDSSKAEEPLGLEIAEKSISKTHLDKNGLFVWIGWGRVPWKNVLISTNLHANVMNVGPETSNPKFFTAMSFNNRGPCKGDSGAPGVFLVGGQPMLLGLVQGTTEPADQSCHLNSNPVRFLSIAEFLPQIVSIISNYESNKY